MEIHYSKRILIPWRFLLLDKNEKIPTMILHVYSILFWKHEIFLELCCVKKKLLSRWPQKSYLRNWPAARVSTSSQSIVQNNRPISPMTNPTSEPKKKQDLQQVISQCKNATIYFIISSSAVMIIDSNFN